MNSKFSRNTTLVIIVFLFLFVFCMYSFYKRDNNRLFLTIDDLPKGAVFVSHDHDLKEVKLTGGVAMRHYATPEAAKAGGPIYGTMGYRIVAIEYDVKSDMIVNKAVGKEFPGWKLLIENSDKFKYDHFHVDFSKDDHSHLSGDS